MSASQLAGHFCRAAGVHPSQPDSPSAGKCEVGSSAGAAASLRAYQELRGPVCLLGSPRHASGAESWPARSFLLALGFFYAHL